MDRPDFYRELRNRPFLSVPELAMLLGTSSERIRGWIQRGELRAANLSDSDRPRWSISKEAVDELLDRRSNVPRQKPAKRRRVAVSNVKEFF